MSLPALAQHTRLWSIESSLTSLTWRSCGWGSGALFFAEKLPNARVTAFSNSRTQKEHIDAESRRRGLSNVTVITGNVVDHEFDAESFDRVVSIEASLLLPSPATNRNEVADRQPTPASCSST